MTTTEPGGLENILAASIMGAGTLAGAALAGPIGAGLGAGLGYLLAPVAGAVTPSSLEVNVDPQYGKIAGWATAAITGAAVFAATGGLAGIGYALASAVPAYFGGKGLFGGYARAAIDYIASFFKGTGNAVDHVGTGVRELGTKYDASVKKWYSGIADAGKGMYNVWKERANRWFGGGAPAPAGAGHR